MCLVRLVNLYSASLSLPQGQSIDDPFTQERSPARVSARPVCLGYYGTSIPYQPRSQEGEERR